MAPAGDWFKGTARKAAKLSIATAAVEEFGDFNDLIDSLPPDNEMASHKPPIKTTAKSSRVKKEKRDVRVRTFLYAASREDDKDFHLILGRDPETQPEIYLTMELSGLPPKASKFYALLKATRDALKQFFGANLPDVTYDFYDPPIPVEVEGSLFFDMSHSTGQRPGPSSLKSRTHDLGGAPDHENRLRALRGARFGAHRSVSGSGNNRKEGSKLKGPGGSRGPAITNDKALRRGMPALDSIRETVEFTSSKHKLCRMIKTTERDAYDKPLGSVRKRRRPR